MPRVPSAGPKEAPPLSARGVEVRRIAEAGKGARGPLLPILHRVLEEFGWIAEEDLPIIADVLNLSRADIHGVLTFYHDFRRTPPPSHRAQICRGEACQAVGAEDLYAAAREHFSGARDVEVREIFCLGNCALGPSAFLNGNLVGHLDLDRIVAAFATQEARS